MADDRVIATLGSWDAWAGSRLSWPVSRIGASVVEWAVQIHRAHYGDAFLMDALDDQPPHPFIRDHRWPLANVPAVASLLTRACALALLPLQARDALAPRQGRARNRDVSSDLVVLEVAGLAVRDGWRIDVEPVLRSGRRPDLRLRRADSELWIEVTATGPDSERKKVETWTDGIVWALRAIEAEWPVEIGGSAESTELDGVALERLLARVASAAELVAQSGTAMRLQENGLAIEIRPRGTGRVGFDGPQLQGDMWVRLERRLIDKARQTEGARAAWIYLEDRSGVFELTDLASLDEAEKLRRLQHNVAIALADCPHVVGVLLSTGALIDASAVDWDAPLADSSGRVSPHSRVLHRRLPGLRSRRTFAIRLLRDVEPSIKAPQRWIEDEGSWLDWALDAAGQPSLAAILDG